jgi:AAA domain-containing protein
MAQSSLPANHIEATIGDVSGGSQVAVGSYIVQIGRVEGGVVNILNGPPAKPRSRPHPVRLLPRAFPGMLDRQTETSNAIQALQAKESVECSGESGSGKTSLLRHLAHQPQASSFSAGVIYFQVNQQSNADLLKSLFDAFYEYDSPVKPTETEIRLYLQALNALILLDDVDITPEQIQFLMNIAPGCTFITATAKRSLFGETREVTLKGLPTGEAVSLFQREFGRDLSAEEQKGAQHLCELVDCIPQRVLRAAHQAREENRSLVDLVPQAKSPSLDQTLAAAEVKPRSEGEKKVLSALAVFYGAPVAAEHVAAVAGVSGVMEMLDDFEGRDLVQSHANRYTLASDVNNALLDNLKPWLARALAHFVDWTELHRSEPEEIAESAQPILLILQWAVAAKHWPEAKRLGHATEEALALSGKWDMWATALQSILKAAQGLQDRANAAWALHQLGTRALCLDARSAALASLNGALALRESLNDRSGAAVTRHNLNILLNPPPPNSEPDKSPGGEAAGTEPTPGPVSTPIPFLLKLGVGLLVLALIGAFVAWLLWPKPPPPPKVVSFTVEPATVPANGQAQLCYEVENANSVNIEPNIGERKPATKECLPVSVEQTTTYTLTAFGADGKTTNGEVTLMVEGPPLAQIVRFEVSRDIGLGGENDMQFRLCYEVRNAERAEIDNDGGPVTLGEPHCQQVKPEQTTTYTLTATGSDGQSISRQVTVDATKPPPLLPQILNFTALPPTIMEGEKAQLCFQLKDASSVQIDSGVSRLEARTDKQCVSVAPIQTTTYTLTAVNSEGKFTTKQTTIKVRKPAPQIASFNARPNSLEGPGSVQLCYEVVHAGSLQINHSVGEVRPANNGCINATVAETTTFTLTATGSEGRVAKSQVTVTVNKRAKHAQIINFNASPRRIQAGASVGLCYEIADAVQASINSRGISVGKDCINESPGKSTEYVLTAVGEDNQPESRRIRVEVDEPQPKHARIIDFNASETRIKPGTSVRLCYEIADAESASLSPPRRDVQVGKHCVDDSPSRSITYVLTAVGEDRRPESRRVSVEVEAERRPDVPQVRITRFEINPTMVHGTQLCYAVENAQSARIEPDFGELRKLPVDCPRIRSLEPRTYTLIATGEDGRTDQKSVRYTPPEPPEPREMPIVIIRFWTTTPSIAPGSQARLCYSTFGKGTAHISPQPGEVTPSPSDCTLVPLRQTTTFTLTVTGPEGQKASKSVVVNVKANVIL